MSKKNSKNKTKNKNNSVKPEAVTEEEEAVLDGEVMEETEAEEAPEAAAPVKKEKADKKNKDKGKKKKKEGPGFFSRLWRKIKDIFTELKKVTWPTFPTVLKNLGVVLVVIVFFTLVIFGVDSLLSFLYNLLVKGNEASLGAFKTIGKF